MPRNSQLRAHLRGWGCDFFLSERERERRFRPWPVLHRAFHDRNLAQDLPSKKVCAPGASTATGSAIEI